MKRLFVFNSKSECPSLLVVASKVCKIIFIVFASLSALISLIAGIQSSSNLGNGGYFLFYLIIGAASFFLLLFQGFLLEILLLSFSIITKNHYEELSDKGKIDDFTLKKQNNNNSMLIDKMNQLNELKNLGILTEEEYNAKKKEILEGM